ncbi:MAG: hypothetical protein BMS9Abin02_0624 [Anaerolineae bacterium]|nr:MAG: hypothetical protein BMS9Abin02_0624 [Anaerolineae bacterium]
MWKGQRLIPIWLLPIIIWGMFLSTACTSQTPLPTRAVEAAVKSSPTRPAATKEIQPISTQASSEIPVTFTAIPVVSPEHQDNGRPLKPTLLPSATSILPTRTPTPSATPQATETPTPYVVEIPDLPPSTDLGPSKMGLHVVRNNDPGIMEFVRRTKPAIMKGVDDLGFLQEVKSASPKTITIGRISIESQDYKGNPEEEARDFVARNLEVYRKNPAVDYWEGWNEPDPNRQYMGWYARFEQERIRQMAQYGMKVAIGSFATGVPELDEFQLFLPAIETAMEYGGLLSLHEYGAPDMAYLYGDPLPGYPAYPDRGSLTFRYRWYYREILEPAGLTIPLVITEAGIDGIIGNRPGPPGLGWQDFQGYWVRQGISDSGIQAFINQLAWYDAGVRQDGYVIGFTVFTAGGFGYWEKYDINPILGELTDYVLGQR